MPKKGSYFKHTVRCIFDKCTYQCNHHCRDTGHPHLPSKVLPSPPTSMAPEIADLLCHHGLVLPSRECHMHGVREYVLFFCISLRFTHVLYQWFAPFYCRVYSLWIIMPQFSKHNFFYIKRWQGLTLKHINFIRILFIYLFISR